MYAEESKLMHCNESMKCCSWSTLALGVKPYAAMSCSANEFVSKCKKSNKSQRARLFNPGQAAAICRSVASSSV